MSNMSEDPVPNMLAHRRYLPWLLLLFFGSGCAALIYEIIWLQLLELVIGSSGISLGVLLGTFMGGMCLGSLMLPRMIPTKSHPLRVYGFLELGIGMIGILVLYGMPYLSGLYVNFSSHGVFARALIAGVCLIPPTVLMGATLPAVARFVEATPEGVSWMGFFYGGNIVGAVAGCLLAGFFLLRFFNTTTATYVAFAVNILVALTGFIMARKSSHETVSGEEQEVPIQESPHQGLIYLAIALSGLCALGAEVVWTRLLSLLMGGTVYTFSIILAVFLVGLGIGSGVGSVLARARLRARIILVLLQMSLAGAVAWAALIISKSLPYWPVNPGLYTSDWGPWYVFQLDILRAAWMILPATILWGASFPIAIAAVASRNRDPGRMVGGIYAANTVGAIVGSLAFSLVVIPELGTQWAEKLLIAISAASAIAALSSSALTTSSNRRENESKRALSFSAIVLTIVALFFVAFLVETVSRIPWVLVAWGRFSATYIAQAEPELVSEDYQPPQHHDPWQWYCTYMGEGMNVSVAVTKDTSGSRFFHGAGKVQASTQPQDMRLQRMLGHLSALTCKNPGQIQDVLVIACGAGVTAGSFMPYPSIKQIEICDIEPLVPRVVAPMFGKENYHIVDGIDKQNPRFANGKEVAVIYDDGRHYIRTLPKDAKFDVITSDPIDPWVKGSAALNTVEFYEMCKSHLKPGGVMSLWMPLYESTSASAKSMVGTFFQVFPNAMIFSNDQHSTGYDAVLLGQAEPSPIDLDKLQSLLDRDEYLPVKESLMEVGFGIGENAVDSVGQGVVLPLFATFAGQASGLRDWVKNAQINRDGDLRLQYLAGMSFNFYQSNKIFQDILSYYAFPGKVFVGSVARIDMLKETMGYLGRREK
jgi:spermidine synthase